MGLLALGESVFTRVTGRGIGGVWGFLWTSSLQSTSGILLYWSWCVLDVLSYALCGGTLRLGS